MELYSIIIHQADAHQIRMTVSEWNDVEYLHIRKYYLDFEGEWLPSKDGISMPLNLENANQLLTGLVDILADAESKEILEKHFKESLDKLYS